MKTIALIQRSSDILSGAPVFAGTRVPMQTLFDYLEEGSTLQDFLNDFPTVSRDQVTATLDLVKTTILNLKNENPARRMSTATATK